MFVQITVAGVVILFILTGVFVPDEIFQRAADEILYDENEESVNQENSEAVAYWRKALGSLDITLALSAGLGTILTAILSYRFRHNRWSNMGRRIQHWISRKDNLPVKVIMQPSGSAFPSESKECLSDQFHEATDDCSAASTVSQEVATAEGKETSESYDTASASEDHEKNQNIDLKVEEIDAILNASRKIEKIDKTSVSEPKYQTFEARLVAVEGSLMRDIDSRMKIFEQQLEEFRNKMRNSNEKPSESEIHGDTTNEFKTAFDDYEARIVRRPSKCVLEEVAATFKNAVPSKRYSSSKPRANAFTEQIGDAVSDSGFIDNVSLKSGDLRQGDTLSCRSSDAGSEAVSEVGSTKKTSSIPNTLHFKRKMYVGQSKNYIKPEMNKSEQQMISTTQDNLVRQQTSLPGTAKKSPESLSSIPTNPAMKRGPRSRQQMKAILQQTQEKLSLRNAAKTRQSNRF